jgi:hypothetical protein
MIEGWKIGGCPGGWCRQRAVDGCERVVKLSRAWLLLRRPVG